MKNIHFIFIFFVGVLLSGVSFCSCQTKIRKSNINEVSVSEKSSNQEMRLDSLSPTEIFIDSRDGELYPIVKIGNQIWMAENLRYQAPGSWLNPDNPSLAYGRLYDPFIAQSVCPTGWHLPTEAEWNELELFLGMNPADTVTSKWRGEHGTKMKSTTGWITERKVEPNGTNSSGFNAFPSGYCDPENGKPIFEGLGHSVGFWSAAKNGMVWQRWLGAPLKGVNRMSDKVDSKFASACRCIKD